MPFAVVDDTLSTFDGSYVKRSAAVVAEVPPAAETVTSTAPVACAGAITVIELELLTVTPTPAEPPKLTETPTVCEDTKFVPVIVTDVPPASAPVFGVTAVTVGAST